MSGKAEADREDDTVEQQKKHRGISRAVFIGIALLNTALYILLFMHIKKVYQFFVIDSLFRFILYSVFIFMPFAVCTVLVFTYRRFSKNSKRWAVSGLVFSVMIMLAFLCTMLIVSPFGSETDNPEHYLKVDLQSGISDSTFGGLFPSEIPAEASDIKYNYRYYSNPENRYELFAQWTLPEAQYKQEKERISKKYPSVMHTKYGDYYSVFISQDEHNAYDYIFFAYDDRTHTVRYVVSYIEDAQYYEIKPYYKNLEW